ncbi:hypothetical protein CHRY9293_00459 [Chryseobacterium potabilaquae]|uniref:Uncharacterized protein n=1 Tax=Chryseobacterium potabilaquae TaxID=2675057 RepID=A0A6N4X5L3_9FLAO|nr:hypothetical protein CHRY9293_00459 [Chryseobacterium potabilaquae]
MKKTIFLAAMRFVRIVITSYNTDKNRSSNLDRAFSLKIV